MVNLIPPPHYLYIFLPSLSSTQCNQHFCHVWVMAKFIEAHTNTPSNPNTHTHTPLHTHKFVQAKQYRQLPAIAACGLWLACQCNPDLKKWMTSSEMLNGSACWEYGFTSAVGQLYLKQMMAFPSPLSFSSFTFILFLIPVPCCWGQSSGLYCVCNSSVDTPAIGVIPNCSAKLKYTIQNGLPLVSYPVFSSLSCFSLLRHNVITFSFQWFVCSKPPTLSLKCTRVSLSKPTWDFVVSLSSNCYFPLSTFLPSPDASSSQGWSTEPLADVGTWVKLCGWCALSVSWWNISLLWEAARSLSPSLSLSLWLLITPSPILPSQFFLIIC